MKLCIRCKQVKPLSSFCKNRREKDGLNSWCRDCAREYKKQYYLDNRERVREEHREYYEKNKDEAKRRAAEFYAKNRDHRKQYENEYRERNKDRILARQNEWLKRQRQTDIQFNIREKIRKSLWHFVKGAKSGKYLTLLGCSLQEFRQHIENQFTDGMSWDNYGINGKWTFDHIVPLTAFDLTDDEQLKKACHFTNVRPLNPRLNMSLGGANRQEKKRG